MTPWDLQKSLIAEIEELLAQMQLKNAAGEDVFGVKGYEQRLPEITDDEEDQSQFFPYFIVRIEEGNTPTDDEPWLVGTTVLFGICDYDKETNGHRTILEMITKITNRFLERPLLDSKFRANQNVSFALQDEDTYPFYFGAIDIKFYVPKIGRSDDFSAYLDGCRCCAFSACEHCDCEESSCTVKCSTVILASLELYIAG